MSDDEPIRGELLPPRLAFPRLPVEPQRQGWLRSSLGYLLDFWGMERLFRGRERAATAAADAAAASRRARFEMTELEREIDRAGDLDLILEGDRAGRRAELLRARRAQAHEELRLQEAQEALRPKIPALKLAPNAKHAWQKGKRSKAHAGGKDNGKSRVTRHEVPGLMIERQIVEGGVVISWKITNTSASHLWEVHGYRKLGGLEGITSPQYRIVQSAERSGREFNRIEPGREVYYLFRLEGWQKRSLRARAAGGSDWVPAESHSLTFSVYLPKETSPLERAQQEAEMARVQAIKRSHEKKELHPGERLGEQMRQHVAMAEQVTQALQDLELRRQREVRAVKSKQLDPEEEEAQIHIIDEMYAAMAQRIRGML